MVYHAAGKMEHVLLTQPETGLGCQMVAVTLRDGRVLEDVAISGSSIVGEVRGFVASHLPTLQGTPALSGLEQSWFARVAR
jgi:hypothetical protein